MLEWWLSGREEGGGRSSCPVLEASPDCLKAELVFFLLASQVNSGTAIKPSDLPVLGRITACQGLVVTGLSDNQCEISKPVPGTLYKQLISKQRRKPEREVYWTLRLGSEGK